MLSKNVSLIIGMITSFSFSMLQASDVNREKISNFSRIATVISFLTPAPFVLGYSASKLQQARHFEKLRRSFETPHEANEVLSRQARHLRKRGWIGFAIGTMLVAPHVASMKIAHDRDKPQQETIKTTPADQKILSDLKPKS